MSEICRSTEICPNNFHFFVNLTSLFKIARAVDIGEHSTVYTNAQTDLLFRLATLERVSIGHDQVSYFNNILKEAKVSLSSETVANWWSHQKSSNFALTLIMASSSSKKIISWLHSNVLLNWVIDNADSYILSPSHELEFFLYITKEDNQVDRFVKATDETGKTALHYAARSGALPVFTALLGNGGNLDSPDNLGETPRQLASLQGNLFSYIDNNAL